jgi:hypothetical protein
MKYYLYRHIRIDKNEPFYIGIGTKPKVYNTYKKEYCRAFSYHDRNSIWNKIISKTDYKVEIIFESNDYDLIKIKEKEFIKLYGQIFNNTGNLSNISIGGDGNCSPFPESSKEKLSVSQIKRVGRGIVILDLNQNYITTTNSIVEAHKITKVKTGNIISCCKNQRKCKKFIFIYKEDYKKEKDYLYKLYYTPVLMLDCNTSKTLKEFYSLDQALEFLNKKGSSAIGNCLRGKAKTAFSYKWKYKTKI